MAYTPPWQTLPPTPELPPPTHQAHAQINNISLWYALYGPPLNRKASEPPVVLLHGGKISSRWWGHLIRSLSPSFSLIALDTRAHGRSSDDLSNPLSYAQFAHDTISLLDLLHVPRASFIGWSDGANTALNIAMGYSRRVDRVIPYGANFNPDQVNTTGLAGVPFGADLVSREEEQYNALNPDPDWARFKERMVLMQGSSPVWQQADFDRIPTLDEDGEAPMIMVAAGDHEEAIVRTTPGEIYRMIPNSQLTILPGMSHFGPLQDPETFAASIKTFLSKAR
ncbi:Alpha/Beta hydrolase protein [Aspergillus californicus]